MNQCYYKACDLIVSTSNVLVYDFNYWISLELFQHEDCFIIINKKFNFVITYSMFILDPFLTINHTQLSNIYKCLIKKSDQIRSTHLKYQSTLPLPTFHLKVGMGLRSLGGIRFIQIPTSTMVASQLMPAGHPPPQRLWAPLICASRVSKFRAHLCHRKTRNALAVCTLKRSMLMRYR